MALSNGILCIIVMWCVALNTALGVLSFVGRRALGFTVWGVGLGVFILYVWVHPALYSAVKNRYPDVGGANIVDPNVPTPSPDSSESAQSRQSGNASSIPTLPPIHLSRFHVSRSEMSALIPSQTSSPTTPPGLPLTQISPTGGAMSEGSRTEPAHLVETVEQPSSDAVGFLQYEGSVSIRVPPTAYIAV